MRSLRIIAIALGVAIIGLLTVFFFVRSPVQAPANTTPVVPVATSTVPGTIVATTTVLMRQATFSPDGSIAVSMPALDGVITSPVGIEGQAAGSWFFEGSFPIKVLDGDGTVLGTGTAQALGTWMTTGTVAFAANIPFATPKDATGTIVFTNDNPSGGGENAKQFIFSVRFGM